MDLKYKQYTDDCERLARSVSIYSSVTAEMLNRFTAAIAGEKSINYNQPNTWKYHLNLCGEYHAIDTPIYVRSMDTMEDVLFNKENLAIHSATKAYYEFGSLAHNNLLKQYPGRALLINGIIAPAKMEDVLSAKTGTVLSCAYNLIEEHEITLFNKIKTWVSNQYHGRYNTQYSIIHEYYNADFMASIKLMLIGHILNLRLAACKTDEVHSYHIWAYLASHGKLNRYMDYLTRYQQLWLYRNIAYIQNHCGLQDTLEWLTENLLTIRGIPLTEYHMTHLLNKQPNEPDPDIGYIRIPINGLKSVATRLPRPLDELMRLEDPLASANEKLRDWYYPEALEKLKNTKTAMMPTKVLESAMIDTSTSEPFLFTEILLNEWADLASKNWYNAFIKIEHELLGDTLYINSRNAFILMWYAFHKSKGITLEVIPEFFAKRVVRKPNLTANDIKKELELESLVLSDYRALATLPTIDSQISIDGFYQQCYAIWEAANKQYLVAAAENNARRRTDLIIAAERFYCDVSVPLIGIKTEYQEWFRKNNLVFSRSNNTELWKDLYETIFSAGTGIKKSDTLSMRQVQKAMLAIFKQLSSYTIQLIEDFQGEDAIPLGLMHPRHEMTSIKINEENIWDLSTLTFDTANFSESLIANLMHRFALRSFSHEKDESYIDPSPKFIYDDSDRDTAIVYFDRDIQHDELDSNIYLDSMATHDALKLLKAYRICPFPLRETRPSSRSFILVDKVNDLYFPPI